MAKLKSKFHSFLACEINLEMSSFTFLIELSIDAVASITMHKSIFLPWNLSATSSAICCEILHESDERGICDERCAVLKRLWEKSVPAYWTVSVN